MRTEYSIVIPARMASQRLPGKPLALLAGRSLLEHVYRCARSSSAQSIVIATDDERIEQHALAFAGQVVMTRPDHPSGSDRIAEVATRLGWTADTIIVNLQGDEPLMPAACLDQVAALLAADPAADMASLYWPIEAVAEARDPNVVKVVVSANGQALYFSRSPIPYHRTAAADSTSAPWLRHVGLYAYRAGALQRFSNTAPTALEQAEKLEQLRVLESGGKIAMARACQFIPAGVDTAEDLERIESVMLRNMN